MKLVLEPRYLFDGSVVAVAHDAVHHHHHDTATTASSHADSHADLTRHTDAPAITEPTVGPSGSPETVLFVDPRVADWQELVAGVKKNVEVVVLDPNQDGITQVTQALSGLTNVHNVEFLTDGTPGSITLGGTTLDTAVLAARANEITGWSAHLAANADVVFWGCDVGQGSIGATFVNDVHTLTGATVGASSDATGAAALGGDWTLEVATGPLHHDVNPFTKDTLASYNDVLDTPQPTVTIAVTDGSVTEGGTLNLGDTLTTTIGFENTAQAATGYSPYVEVWVPTGLTLSGAATENGVALTDVTAAVSGGTAINPLTHQTETAPTGISDGTLYVFELPSSVAAGATAAPIIASFTMSSDTSLLGEAMTIAARGGFLDGPVGGSGENIEGDTFSSTATVIQPLDPSVSIIGTSNDTQGLGTVIDTASGNVALFDPNGTSSGSAVSVAPGEIVRMRIVDQLAGNSSQAVSLQMTLPSGLTYENDGSTTIALVSPSGNIGTSTSLGTGIQVANSSADLNTLSLVSGSDTSDAVTAVLSSGAISATSVSGSGQTVTFNLGNLTTHDANSTYVVIEFNALVGSTVTDGTSLTPALSTLSGSATTATQTVQMPSYATSIGGFTPALLGVLDLPLFDASLGTLTQMQLTLTGNVYSTGSLTTSTQPTGRNVTFSTKTEMSLAQDPSGPTLPSGTPTINSSALTLREFFRTSTITINTPLTFDVSPGDSPTNPLTASTSASVTTNLSGFEAVGGGNIPVDVYSATTTTITTTGGNFSQNVTTQGEAALSVSYTYTSATSAADAYLAVKAPTVTLTKEITSITYSGTTATVTYVDTVTNTSTDATAYGLTLTDTGDGNTSDTLAFSSDSGAGSSAAESVTGNVLTVTMSSLAAGGTETVTYTEQVPVSHVGSSVTDSQTALATVTSYDLSPALFKPTPTPPATTGSEELAGTVVTPQDYTVTADAPFDSISGTVNQDTAATFGGGISTPADLVALANETVTVSGTGLSGTESVQTDSSGDFTLLVPDGLSSVTVSAAVAGTLNSAVLDNHPSETGTPSPLPLTSTATETGYDASNTGSFSFDPVSGSSYSGITFDFWQPSTPTPTLTVVGGSNDTAGLGTQFDPTGTTSPGVLMTDGEIVRERATLELTAGSSDNTTMTVTLPSNLTFDDPNSSSDSSVTVLLVSADGSVATTLTGTGLQLTDASPNTAKLDLGTGADTIDPVTTVLPNSDISTSGNQVTFNLGNLNDTAGSYQVIVEFNAIVDKAAPTGATNTLQSQMSGSVNGSSTATVSDYVEPQAPTITLAKTITDITYSGTTATVTYTDTVSNTSGVTAYALSLTDTGDGNNPSDTISYVSDSGSGVGNVTTAGITSNELQASISSLAGGDSVTITYTEQVPVADVAPSVAASKTAQAEVSWYALNPAKFTPANTGNEVLVTTTETPPTYSTTATAPFDSIAGTVNQDIASTFGGGIGTPADLVTLAGQDVSLTFSGQTGTESTTTDSNGDFSLLAPVNEAVTITVTPTGPDAPVPAGEQMDNAPHTTGSPSLPSASDNLTTQGHPGDGTLTFTPAAGNSYAGVTFDFWVAPDTNPVLANGPTSPATYTSGDSGVTLFPAVTASDTQLDNSFAHDFSGVTLTMQRYDSTGTTASPNANDSFIGGGTSSTGVYLDSTNHHVLLNGTEVGTYTESGGVLSVTFLSTGISNTTLDTVVQGINYSYTGTVTSEIAGVKIGIQIDDANNDPISLNGAPLDPSGPHDQGVGGDLFSNILIATVNLEPAALSSTATPLLTVVGGSNDTAGLGTQFDPTGTTSPGVLMTDGEIVRERATLELTAGTADNTTMTVTLPSDLTFDPNYASDNSVTVLLVSADGSVTSTLPSGAQLTDASPNTAKLDLGTGADTTDPVTTVLPSSDVSVSGNQVTFSLGNLADSAGSYQVIVEFNAIVGTGLTNGTVLNTQMQGSVNDPNTATVNDYVNVQKPTVTLQKQVEDIVYNPDGSASITYVDTITDTSGAPINDLSLTDPGVGVGTASYSGTHAGNGTGASGTATGSSFTASLSSLPAGGSETFTYTVTLQPSQIPTAVANSQVTADVQATVYGNWLSSDTETLVGTTVTTDYSHDVAEAGLSEITGTVNLDNGSTFGTDSPLEPLSGQTVTISYTGGTGSTTTDGSGNFTMLVPDSQGPVTLQVAPTGSVQNLSHQNTILSDTILDNHPDQATSLASTSPSSTGYQSSNTAMLTFTPAPGTSYGGISFDFWTAPVQPPFSNPPPPILPIITEPLIPQLALVGSVENRFIIEDQQTVIQVPEDIFVDSDPNAFLTFDAKLPDGTPLPSWLSFDSNNLTFSGTPPYGSHGRVEIVITARDQWGNTADASFSILIGRKEEDLSKLLLESNTGFHPYGFQTTADAPHPTPDGAPPVMVARNAPAPHRDTPQPRYARAHIRSDGHGADHRGLSAALHAASHLGALTRARALLDGLDKLTQSRNSI